MVSSRLESGRVNKCSRNYPWRTGRHHHHDLTPCDSLVFARLRISKHLPKEPSRGCEEIQIPPRRTPTSPAPHHTHTARLSKALTPQIHMRGALSSHTKAADVIVIDDSPERPQPKRQRVEPQPTASPPRAGRGDVSDGAVAVAGETSSRGSGGAAWIPPFALLKVQGIPQYGNR